MSTLYLSRARLCPDAFSREGFARIIRDDALGHHAVWTMFGNEPRGSRPFLYRQETTGANPSFLVLSTREPDNPQGLWNIETKPFTPSLTQGTRLQFAVRVNPTLRRARRETDGGASDAPVGKRVDVVMDAKHKARLAGERVDERGLIETTTFAWLSKRAGVAGFRVEPDGFAAVGYRQHRVPRKGRTPPATFSTVDLSGTLVVEDPARLVEAIARGIGPEKAFGCGLLLIRRA